MLGSKSAMDSFIFHNDRQLNSLEKTDRRIFLLLTPKSYTVWCKSWLLLFWFHVRDLALTGRQLASYLRILGT